MSSTLPEHTRLQYLDALGIEAWRARGSEAPTVEEAHDAIAPGAPPVEQANESIAPDAPPVEQANEAIAPDAPAASSEVALKDWDTLRAAVSGCTRCELHRSRTQTVFGVGRPTADLLVIGEAPGAEEDRRGEPFVGRAGKLLDEMLRAIGLDRGTVFIANVLKCRPPGNRDPKPEESASCRPYLDRQIELIAPKVILAVGRIAAQNLLGTDLPLGRMRGQPHRLATHDIPVVVTYHPAYLLRTPAQKRKTWQDLCRARALLAEARA